MRLHLLVFTLLVFGFSISSFAYEYNSTYTNLSVEWNFYCANIPTIFTVYNSSEYVNKETHEENICRGNETTDDDNCFEWEAISAEIKVYGGPLDSLPLVYEGKLNGSSQFTHTFTNSDGHLVEVRPSGTFNDYHTIVEIIECKRSTQTKEETQNETLKDKSFSYSQGISLLVSQTNITTNDKITVSIITDTISLPKINNSLTTFKFDHSITNYSKHTLTIPIGSRENYKTLEVYKAEPTTWINISSYSLVNNNVILDDVEVGTYTVIGIPKEEEENQSQAEEIVEEEKEENIVQVSKNKNAFGSLPLLFGGIILFTGFIFIIMKIKNKKKEEKIEEDSSSGSTPTTNSQDTKKEQVEVISSYAGVYEKTKAYVQKYKNSYSRDQIYRALNGAQVPKDIIDKTFEEEY